MQMTSEFFSSNMGSLVREFYRVDGYYCFVKTEADRIFWLFPHQHTLVSFKIKESIWYEFFSASVVKVFI